MRGTSSGAGITKRVTRAVVVGLLFGGAGWATLSMGVAGCSSDNAAPPAPAPLPGICPNTVTMASGAKCSQETMDCPIGYTCGATPEQAHCVCTSGKFVCTDATGAVVPAGADPQCVPPGMGNDTQCPSTEAKATQSTCMTAGLLCYYAGAICPENNGLANTDVCQCKNSPLSFECEPQVCNPRSDAAAIDDASSPPVPDAGAGDASDG